MRQLQIDGIRINPDQPDNQILSIIEKKYKIALSSYKILKKSLDARKKTDIFYSYRILIETDDRDASRLLTHKEIIEYLPQPEPAAPVITSRRDVIIIGSGPAGLFCGLRLIESGVHVTILERGKQVEERMDDISSLEKTGQLDPESNVLFGEGGAGTYSDGKLTTRVNRPEISWVYKKLIEHGAPESIAYESKPHIGSDLLRDIVRNIRKSIISSGSEIKFGERVDDLILKNGRIHGATTFSGNEYSSETVVLATGHSARDMYELLIRKGITLEKKGFAIGSRIEHPAEEINAIQYGSGRFSAILPAADYRLVYNNNASGRGVYSFCMCPGGTVINSSSEPERLCTNGMSLSDRAMFFSNAAIVVTVNPDDTADSILSGIDLQREIEALAYTCGGGDYRAPAQGLKSFLTGSKDSRLPDSSYNNGIFPSKLDNFLPGWITSEMRTAIRSFDRRMKGFISDRAVLIGAETRTSSPVRIRRGDDRQSVSIKGLYPTGEGAGYSGGIISSAIDGIKTADIIVSKG